MAAPEDEGESYALSTTARSLRKLAVGQGATAVSASSDAANSDLSNELGSLLSTVVRELTVNAIGALDKRFYSLPSRVKRRKSTVGKLRCVVQRSEDGLWLRVADSGCGMTRGDLINRLGAPGASRIERGDEVSWRDALTAASTAEEAAAFLRDFGGGFFAAFAVGDALRVVTKHEDDVPYSFELEADEADFKISSLLRQKKDLGPFFGGELEHAKFVEHSSTATAAAVKELAAFPGESGTVVSLRLSEAFRSLGDARLEAIVASMKDSSQYIVELRTPDQLLLTEATIEPDEEEQEEEEEDDEETLPPGEQKESMSMNERAKYIPLRLSYSERKILRLVESAIKVSGYVDRVDSAELAGKAAKRRQFQLAGIAGVLSGIVVAVDYEEGRRVARERCFAEKDRLLKSAFEIARRYKILNPERMRSEYGQLAYLMQDAADLGIDELGFEVATAVKSVYNLLDRRGGLGMLDDPLVEDATMEVLPDASKSRSQIQQTIRRKERSIQALVRRYSSSTLSSDHIELCLYSICDNNSYLNSSRLPIDLTLEYLRTHFSSSSKASLAISGEDGSGARLSHNHSRQFKFAEQSLLLWREIVGDMFRLWHVAEADLLSGDAPYKLRDTGQGLQRVQPCPRSYAAMRNVLATAARKGSASEGSSWVGSSMVHMGDHNVPNALVFLDKYAQVARILRPLVQVLARTKQLCGEDANIHKLVSDAFKSPEDFTITVLADFFKHAFDGSGADNFYDAGSCVDGRLTSAWNWCSQIATKPYFIIFKLCGFAGFDGQFN